MALMGDADKTDQIYFYCVAIWNMTRWDHQVSQKQLEGLGIQYYVGFSGMASS